MTPKQIYDQIYHYIGNQNTIICNLHSACSPIIGKNYICGIPKTKTNIINFDSVKEKVDSGNNPRKSVDAIVNSPSNSFFCFIEMKSWNLFLTYNGTEENIHEQAKKYKSDLPEKLAKSIEICKDVIGNESIFENCKILYILLTDIPIETDKNSEISSIDYALTALAGTSSNLKVQLCNQLSRKIMENIQNIETRYWECSNFDAELSKL